MREWKSCSEFHKSFPHSLHEKEVAWLWSSHNLFFCFFLLACSLYGSLHAESCLLPACSSLPSCIGSHCTDSVHLLQQIRNEKQISVSKHTCFKPSGHFWAPLIVFSQSWLGGITQWLCQQLQFKSCFLFILSYKFWLCSVCWIWCRPRAGKQL